MRNSQKFPESEGEGNTKKSSPKKSARHRNWIFTWNNYTRENINSLKQTEKCKYLFQPEIGENGTPHLQGCLLFTESKSFSQIKLMFPEMHFEAMKYKRKALEYCIKERTRAGARHTNILEYKEIYDVLSDHTPYPWQQKIIDIVCGDPDPRKIHWVWEPIGNVGKTILCKHLVLKYQATIVGGKTRDAMYAIAATLKEDKPVTIIVFDIPRSSYGNLSYPALETIKNGLFFSSKYESGMVIFNVPHVIVFANAPPNESKLSEDRWDIILIKEGTPPPPAGEEGSSLLLLEKE